MPAATRLGVAEFEAIFESVKNWGRWGPDDELGTLNFITPEKVREAAGLVRSGRRVSMAIPINKVAGPDNPQQAMHFVVQSHDVPVDESKVQEQLPAAPLLMTAYAVAWVVVFGYVWTLWSRLSKVEREILEVSRRIDAGSRR